MPAIAGVATKRNKRRQLTHIIVDVRRHPQALTALKELGLVPKSQFEIDCEDAITTQELEEHLIHKVKEFYAGT